MGVEKELLCKMQSQSACPGRDTDTKRKNARAWHYKTLLAAGKELVLLAQVTNDKNECTCLR